MLNVKKMIESAEVCLGWPYVSPGTNDARGIDCSGLFVKIFRDQGASIYHGSNTIFRSYCSDKGKLTSESQLIPGMAVFKWNANTPAKFDDDLGDFQHIGIVVGINPLRIIHASTGTMCVTTDTKVGTWKYWGRLKNVDYDGTDVPDGDPSKEQSVGYITADKVNLRTGPSSKQPRIEYLNTGDKVEVLSESGSWLKCRWNGKTGFVMAKFVSVAMPPPEDGSTDEPTEQTAVVHIVSPNGGKVNIRRGNGVQYSKIKSVESGTYLPFVAMAENEWYAVEAGASVGWVSADYAEIEGGVG